MIAGSDEESLIQAVLDACPVPRDAALIGAGDDAAVLAPVAELSVLSADAMVEGIHWDATLRPQDVGYKLVAVNVSDLAAMGATPRWALLSMALPEPADIGWVRDFAQGLAQGLSPWGIALLGGDTVRAPGKERFLNLTIGGVAGRVVRRSGARPGQDLWVTGSLGGAGAALRRASPPESLLLRLTHPVPRVEMGRLLAERYLATAMMDLSDGLALDLPRLCAASGCGALIEPELLPVHPELFEHERAMALRGGEDYELLFTALPESAPDILAIGRDLGLPVHRIGGTQPGSAPSLPNGSWPAPDFQHFRPSSVNGSAS